MVKISFPSISSGTTQHNESSWLASRWCHAMEKCFAGISLSGGDEMWDNGSSCIAIQAFMPAPPNSNSSNSLLQMQLSLSAHFNSVMFMIVSAEASAKPCYALCELGSTSIWLGEAVIFLHSCFQGLSSVMELVAFSPPSPCWPFLSANTSQNRVFLSEL